MPQPGIELGPSAWQANTLPRRYKNRLVPQGSTSVSYSYHYYIFPFHLKIRPRISIWATTHYQATKPIGPPSPSNWVIYVGRQM